MRLSRYVILIIVFSMLVSSVQFTTAAEGDTKAEAKAAIIGENVGSLATQSSEFWFEFNSGNSSQRFILVLDMPLNADFDIEVQDNAGNIIYEFTSFSSPEKGEILGESIYYIRIYSSTGSGSFTLNLNEALPGNTEDNPAILVEGDNYYNSTNRLDDIMYLEFSDFVEGELIKINVIPITTDTELNLYAYNGEVEINAYNFSGNIAEAETAYIQGLNQSISIDLIYSHILNLEVEFIVRVAVAPTPTGLEPSTAYNLNLSQATEIQLFSGLTIYANLTIDTPEWYTFEITSTTNYWLQIDYSIGGNQFSERITGENPRNDYLLIDTTGILVLEIYTYEPAFNISLTPTQSEPPAGISGDFPILISPGDQIEHKINSEHTYYEASTTIDSAYVFSIDIEGTDNFVFNIRAISEFEFFDSLLRNDNTGEYLLIAPAETIRIILSIDEININVTVTFEEVELPAHYTYNDAQVVELGDTNIETIYPNQNYWLSFTGESDKYYQISIQQISEENRFVNPILFDSNREYVSGDSYLSGTTPIYIFLNVDFVDNITINIQEIDSLPTISTEYYSSNFRAGDFLEYEFTSSSSLPFYEDVLQSGDKVRVDVIQNSPIITDVELTADYFQYTVNGQSGFEFPFNLFVLPVEIVREDGEVIDQTEILEGIYGSSSIEYTNDRILVNSSYTDVSGGFYQLVLEYDATDMYIISMDYFEQTDEGIIDFSFTLVDSKVSRPSQNGDTDDAPFSLPIRGSNVLIALFTTVLLVRRKIKYEEC